MTWAARWVIAAVFALPAAAAENVLDRELAAVVEDRAHPLASLSVLAVREGKVVYEKQFGRRHIDPDIPANAETMYRIASISKLVTALGVMRLVEDGKLELDRDVSDYLGFKFRNPNFPDAPVSLRMMMSHTSSLRDDGGYYWDKKLDAHLKDVVLPGGKYFGKGAMWAANAKPGDYFQYANLPWGVIGTVMERATGERFDRLMQRLVLDPLQLKGGFHPADFSAADLANVATLYRKRVDIDDKEVWKPEGPWVAQVDDYLKDAPVPRAFPAYEPGTNGTLFGPQGNLRLSARGLADIMLMLMNRGEHRGKRFLKAATVDAMLAAQWRADASGKNGNSQYGTHKQSMNEWGLGNQHFLDIGGDGAGDRLVDGGGFKAVGHTGDAWGLTSAMVFDPARKNGIIFISGGPGFDPATYPGKYSAHPRHHELIFTALYRRAILGVTK